jgi:hypothetical protein
MRTYWLSLHVPYACRHSGACCSSRWPIPIERSRVAAVQALRPDTHWLVPAEGAPPDVAGLLAVSASGHCVFHRDGCEIQRAYGAPAMPSACQHFPREVLIDGRGVFVTLSHFCPTAADLLFDHEGPIEIVEGPPAVPGGEPEGLDARDVLPPLLTAGVLMDPEGYSAWEAHMVRVLGADDGRTPEAAVAQLAADLATLQRWRPRGSSLAAEAARLAGEQEAAVAVLSDRPQSGARTREEMEANRVIRRYLAARAFASWMAYQGGGLSAIVASLRFALKVLREEMTRRPLRGAIRETDLQILHLTPRDELARRCG